jgi:hypothetical protein
LITTLLVEHSALVPVLLLLVAVACVGVGWLVPRSAGVLAGLSLVPVLALTLIPAGGNRLDHVLCVVQFSVPTPGSVELLANVALFLPPAFFATLATRRPLVVLAAGVGLSAAIEALQAVVFAIGRACDTNDWMMNTIGVAVGVLLAVGLVRLSSR